MGSRNAQNHRAMAFVQVCRWLAHAAVEAVQDESSGGEGAFETPGAGTAGVCDWRDSNREVEIKFSVCQHFCASLALVGCRVFLYGFFHTIGHFFA